VGFVGQSGMRRTVRCAPDMSGVRRTCLVLARAIGHNWLLSGFCFGSLAKIYQTVCCVPDISGGPDDQRSTTRSTSATSAHQQSRKGHRTVQCLPEKESDQSTDLVTVAYQSVRCTYRQKAIFSFQRKKQSPWLLGAIKEAHMRLYPYTKHFKSTLQLGNSATTLF
jgi:hypothetical protein